MGEWFAEAVEIFFFEAGFQQRSVNRQQDELGLPRVEAVCDPYDLVGIGKVDKTIAMKFA